MPHREFLHAIELLGTKVLPQIRAELGRPATASAATTKGKPA